MPASKDLIAASATPLVLSILQQGDSYGYEIIQKIREASGGSMDWADGMLYPILHRLEKKEWVESYWGQSDAGRKRKYYKLRRSGRKALKDQHQTWTEIYALLQRLNGGPHVQPS